MPLPPESQQEHQFQLPQRFDLNRVPEKEYPEEAPALALKSHPQSQRVMHHRMVEPLSEAAATAPHGNAFSYTCDTYSLQITPSIPKYRMKVDLDG